MTSGLIPVPPTPIGYKIWRNTGEMRLDEPDPANDPAWKQIHPSVETHDRTPLDPQAGDETRPGSYNLATGAVDAGLCDHAGRAAHPAARSISVKG